MTVTETEDLGTTAEKLLKFLGTSELEEKIRAAQAEFCKPPFLKRMQYLAKECGIKLNTFTLASAIVVVRGKGNEYLASVCVFLHNEEEVPAASIRDSISTAYHLYIWEHEK